MQKGKPDPSRPDASRSSPSREPASGTSPSRQPASPAFPNRDREGAVAQSRVNDFVPGEGGSKMGFLLGTAPRASDPASRAAIIRFAAVGTLVYMLLIIAQPTIGPAYASFFRSFGTSVLTRVGGHGFVNFLDLQSKTLFQDVDAVTPGDLPTNYEIPGPEGEKDTLLVLQNRKTPGHLGLFRSSSRLMAYIPTALFLALFVATPGSWRKRLFVLIVGFAFLHLFLAFRIWLYVVYQGFADASKKYHIFEPGRFFADLLRRADRVLVDDPTFNYIAPVLVWMVVMLAVNFAQRFWHSRTAAIRPRRRRR